MDRAAGDAGFRARLVERPKAVIEQELGVTIPASLTIRVHEESGTAAHLVLPPDSRLSEGDLKMVVSGRSRFVRICAAIEEEINRW